MSAHKSIVSISKGFKSLISLFCNVKTSWLYFLSLCVLAGCQPSGKEQASEDPKYLDPYLDAIRISATAENPLDSSHEAKIHIWADEYDFGQIKEGDTAIHTFRFVNSGNARLLLNRVQTSCGCTHSDWPRGFISPGDTASLSVSFDSHDRSGPQEKTITIFANTNPVRTTVRLKGTVIPR